MRPMTGCSIFHWGRMGREKLSFHVKAWTINRCRQFASAPRLLAKLVACGAREHRSQQVRQLKQQVPSGIVQCRLRRRRSCYGRNRRNPPLTIRGVTRPRCGRVGGKTLQDVHFYFLDSQTGLTGGPFIPGRELQVLRNRIA